MAARAATPIACFSTTIKALCSGGSCLGAGLQKGQEIIFALTQEAQELMQCFDRQRYALTSADAKRDKPARQTVASHRVDQLGRQDGTSRADGMAMGHGAAVDFHRILTKLELATDTDRDCCESVSDS